MLAGQLLADGGVAPAERLLLVQGGDVARRVPLPGERIHPLTDEGSDRLEVFGRNGVAHHEVAVALPRGGLFAVSHDAVLPAEPGSPAVLLQQLGNRALVRSNIDMLSITSPSIRLPAACSFSVIFA